MLLAVVTAVFQHTPSFTLDIAGLKPMLFVPFVVCIAMHERSFSGLAFGVLAGTLWDFASSGADGMFTLMLSVIGFVVGFLITFYLRNRLVTAVVLNFVSCMAVSVAYWMVFILRKGYDGMWEILFTHFLPIAIYSSLFVFVYYYIVGYVIRKTEKNDSSVHTYIR